MSGSNSEVWELVCVSALEPSVSLPPSRISSSRSTSEGSDVECLELVGVLGVSLCLVIDICGLCGYVVLGSGGRWCGFLGFCS